MRVLVFDDDAAIGRLVVRVAAMAGMEAAAVTDADTFARQLRAAPPEVIVLDLQLGNTDGVEQLRLLAEHGYAGSLMLMSGFDARVLGTARALGESLGLKLAGVLQKPVQVAELEAMFERVQSAAQPLSVERLLAAVANDEFSLDFQPVVTRNPRALTKLEALVRWEHPVAGRIQPRDFLPLAEDNAAAIDAITDWVVGAVAEAYQVLAELGTRVPLAVNLTAHDLHDLALPDRLGQRLRAGGMPAHQLCVEITESAAFSDAARCMDILSRIRLKGMQLAIDDFGTGYSSLKLLREMPFTEIKIDRSFVRDATTSRDSRVIIKSIFDLATNMEMSCVAEGVETAAAADLLEQLGIRQMQGSLIAAAMPVEAVPAWLAAWTQTGRTPAPGDRAGERAADAPPAAGPALPGGRPGRPPGAAWKSGKPGVQLSPRQLDVIRLLSEGSPVKEIARRLNLGVGTVKVHLALAYSALGARNRMEAVRLAGPILEARANDQRIAG